MKLTLFEFESRPIDPVWRERAARLRAFDERIAGKKGRTGAFDWSRKDSIRALNHVGVIQVPGLSVEILPKVSRRSLNPEEAARQIQDNLIHMLAVAGMIPARHRQMARLTARRRPLLDALIRVFAETLLSELRRGPHHGYVRIEENSRFFRGKLLVAQDVQQNHVHRERSYVAYDEFLADTPLNRVLRATCASLLRVSRDSWTARCLREALIRLDDVEAIVLQDRHFEEVHLDRTNQRFADLFEFCWIVHRGRTPEPKAGEDTHSFSLLFPMWKVFEAYIGRTIRRRRAALGLPERSSVHLQATGHRRSLLTPRPTGRGKLYLQPDVLIHFRGESESIVLDTKWKILERDPERQDFLPLREDLFQLYAYAREFVARESVLLYPRSDPGIRMHEYHLTSAPEHRVRIAFVDLTRDLVRDQAGLLEDLRLALEGHR